MDIDSSPPDDRDSTPENNESAGTRAQSESRGPATSRRHSARKIPAEDDELVTIATASPQSQRTRRSSNRSSDMGFTVKDITDDLDGGYDADTEVVRPHDCVEPDTDEDSTAQTPIARTKDGNLADRLRSLSFDSKKRGHRRMTSSTLRSLSKKSRKRGHIEDRDGDSGTEVDSPGLRADSVRGVKRFKAGGSPDSSAEPASAGTPGSQWSGIRVTSADSPTPAAETDAMEVDLEAP